MNKFRDLKTTWDREFMFVLKILHLSLSVKMILIISLKSRVRVRRNAAQELVCNALKTYICSESSSFKFASKDYLNSQFETTLEWERMQPRHWYAIPWEFIFVLKVLHLSLLVRFILILNLKPRIGVRRNAAHELICNPWKSRKFR